MREGTRPAARVGVALGALLLGACAGDASEPAAEADDSASPSTSQTSETSEEASASPSPTEEPSPEKPREPKFRDNRAGKRAFVSYVLDGWAYGLRTNDPSVLIDASGRKPCRGCAPLRRELKQRDKEGWYVDFPGVKVRKVTFRRDGDVEVATVVANLPASRSLFEEDGTLRNENKARKGVRFLLDIRADGKGKRRSWTLRAFAVK